MLLYVATYPRCGSGVLRHLLLRNFSIVTESHWDMQPGGRRSLADADAIFAAKTHAPPVADPQPGERAIQLIRHPGPALASHFRLHLDTRGKERPLKRFIAGQRLTGDWTSYHRAWSETSMPLLRMRYEDVTPDPTDAILRIAEFLGLPAPARVDFETLEEAHRRAPMRNPAAPPDAWRALFQGKDLERLREAHGALASEWGYCFD
jgi:hypothetical protein